MCLKINMKSFLKKLFITNILIVSSVTYSNDVLVDSDTNLEWQLQGRTDDVWDEAVKYCASLDGGGWRLPNVQELLTLMDFKGGYIDINCCKSMFT